MPRSRNPSEAFASSPTPALVSGTRRAVSFGNYRLFARLGSGGMADVYLAIAHGAMDVNRLVVVKKLREEQAGDGATRAMFLDEARLAARLSHPNVVQTFEAGGEDDSYWLAMEYIDGQPFSRVLTALKRQGKLLSPRLAARVCSDFLNGLHYAHELTDFDGKPLGIVHRDVSPQNVMISCDGAVKVVDFGIAKAAGTPQTAHGVFKGKVAFMAPEQVRAENVDRRADVFAAGIVLWESVTGKHLMAESTPAATLYNLLSRPIPRASEANPDVPPALDDIIARALRREVSERYPTAKAMRDELEAFIVSAGGVQNEELGTMVKELFAESREKLQAQIRAQLTTLSLGRGSESNLQGAELAGSYVRPITSTSVHPVHGAPTDASLVARLVTLDDGFIETSSKASVLRVITKGNRAPATTRRLALGFWFFVPLIALAGASVALFRAQRVHEPAMVAPSAAAAAAPATPPAPVVTVAPVATTATDTAPVAVATATATATPLRAQAAPMRPAWSPPSPKPAPASPATATTPSNEGPAPAAPTAAPAKTADAPQGRTFRRDL